MRLVQPQGRRSRAQPATAAPPRAQLPSCRRPRRRPPAWAATAASSARPPLPPRRLRAQIPPAAAASPAPRLRSFLSLLFSPSHRRLLASTPSCYLQSSPDPRASRCQEVSLRQRISGQRILSIRIAAAAAARRPGEGAPWTPRAASEAERGGPGLPGPSRVSSSRFSPPPPSPAQGKEPPLGWTRLKRRRQRAAG